MLGQYIQLTDRNSADDFAASIAAMRVESAAFRKSMRFSTRLKVIIFLTERGSTKGQIRGETEDISESGMGLVLTDSLCVGNDYWAKFESGVLIHPGLVHMRCVRVRLLDQKRFETGFRFFNALHLPGTLKQSQDDEIL